MRTKLIYKLIDPLSCQTFYVGSTSSSLMRRLRQHVNDSRSGRTHPVFQRIRHLLRYDTGPVIALVETIGADIADNRERHWIRYYKAINPGLLNQQSGGRKGYRQSAATAKYISQRHRRNGVAPPKLATELSLPYICRPVRCIDTGVEYRSIRAAAQSLGVAHTTVLRSIQKGHKSMGTSWEYVHADSKCIPSRRPEYHPPQ